MVAIGKSLPQKRNIETVTIIREELIMLSNAMEDWWSPALHTRLLQFYVESIVHFTIPNEKELKKLNLAKRHQCEQTILAGAYAFLCENNAFLFDQDASDQEFAIYKQSIGDTIKRLCGLLLSDTSLNDVTNFFSGELERVGTERVDIARTSDAVDRFSVYDNSYYQRKANRIKNPRKPSRGEISQEETALLCGVAVSTIKNWEGTNGRPAKPPLGYPGRANAELLRIWSENVYHKLPNKAIRRTLTKHHTHTGAGPSQSLIQYHGDLSDLLQTYKAKE